MYPSKLLGRKELAKYVFVTGPGNFPAINRSIYTKTPVYFV